jgi:hypothetical protein
MGRKKGCFNCKHKGSIIVLNKGGYIEVGWCTYANTMAGFKCRKFEYEGISQERKKTWLATK